MNELRFKVCCRWLQSSENWKEEWPKEVLERGLQKMVLDQYTQFTFKTHLRTH